MKIKIVLFVFALYTMPLLAHNSYTGGYSGAPGKSKCASSCHGSTSGTMTVTGFPSTYVPGQTYRLVIAHYGGNKIVNFNATTRLGSSTTVAGTFSNVLNAVNYSGSDGGMYASPHSIDSAVVNWTAPQAGSGTINFYAAAFQGSTSSGNGQSSVVTLSASEVVTSIDNNSSTPMGFMLEQNYPNPFNPSTSIQFQIPSSVVLSEAEAQVTLKVYDLLGREMATLLNEKKMPGNYTVQFDGTNLPSGIYLYKLSYGSHQLTKKMVLLK